MSKGKFKDLVMELVNPQAENFRGRLDTPVVCIGQIPAEDQCRLAGIEYFLSDLNVRDWPEDPQNYQTPNAFYVAWTDEGARFMDRKVQDVRQELAFDERGGTEIDAIDLYVVKPKVLKTRFLDLPATAVGSVFAGSLHLWHGDDRGCSAISLAMRFRRSALWFVGEKNRTWNFASWSF